MKCSKTKSFENMFFMSKRSSKSNIKKKSCFSIMVLVMAIKEVMMVLYGSTSGVH